MLRDPTAKLLCSNPVANCRNSGNCRYADLTRAGPLLTATSASQGGMWKEPSKHPDAEFGAWGAPASPVLSKDQAAWRLQLPGWSMSTRRCPPDDATHSEAAVVSSSAHLRYYNPCYNQLSVYYILTHQLLPATRYRGDRNQPTK